MYSRTRLFKLHIIDNGEDPGRFAVACGYGAGLKGNLVDTVLSRPAGILRPGKLVSSSDSSLFSNRVFHHFHPTPCKT